MKKNILLLAALVFFISGCSNEKWQGMYYIYRAEEADMKAYRLMTKPAARDKRLVLYRQACDYFLKAYKKQPGIFTLGRIEMAANACLWVEDFTAARTFNDFQERYAEKHPKEAAYGDIGVPIIE